MLKKFWKHADAAKNVAGPVSHDARAENCQQHPDEEKILDPGTSAEATEAGDDPAPADDRQPDTLSPPQRAVDEPEPLAQLPGEAQHDSPPLPMSPAECTVIGDDEAEADDQPSAVESAAPGMTPSLAAPSEQGLDEGELAALAASQPRRTRTRRMVKPAAKARVTHSPEQRLLLLDTWRRSGLPAKDFAAMIGISKHTLYKWKQQFDQHGPEGLMPQRRGAPVGSRLPEITKRSILMMKEAHPEWGCQRISDMLQRGPALPASASAVGRVLHEAGYETVDTWTRPNPSKPRRFERAKPNQMWQTDLFTFMLKRQNRRVHLVAFLDDHSRFIVSFGLTASASTAFVIEVVEAAIACYGPPEEILTDNGPQYVTWRGKSRFTRHLEARGVRQIVARPKRPQTLGKVERFWGTLWRELLETAVFIDMEDARQRIALFIDHYNFQRTHRGVDGLVPADRFFSAAPEVLRTLQQRVSANALAIARHGVPKKPFYVTGQVGGQPFSVHAEGERVFLHRSGEEREEVELTRPPNSSTEASSSSSDANEPDEVASPMPTPLCPDGSPTEPAGEPAVRPPLAPGQSGLDGSLGEQASPPTVHRDDNSESDRDAQHEGGQS